MKSPQRDTESEFDAYASHYADRVDDPLKRWVGGGLDEFVALKVRWLMRFLRQRRLPGGRPRLLDYGCGTGEFMLSLRREGFIGDLEGADVSANMLAEARAACGQKEPPPLHLLVPGSPTLGGSSFDIVVACCVLHHVPPEERGFTLAEIHRLLKPGGCMVVFEHNPLNPLTVMIVKRAPVDQNAVLLGAGEVARRMRAAGFSSIRASYILFTPVRLRWLQWVDRMLAWLPLGGQYAVTAFKQGGLSG